jgi:hypothetical protein
MLHALSMHKVWAASPPLLLPCDGTTSCKAPHHLSVSDCVVCCQRQKPSTKGFTSLLLPIPSKHSLLCDGWGATEVIPPDECNPDHADVLHTECGRVPQHVLFIVSFSPVFHLGDPTSWCCSGHLGAGQWSAPVLEIACIPKTKISVSHCIPSFRGCVSCVCPDFQECVSQVCPT